MINLLEEPSLLNHVIARLHRDAFGLVDILEGEDLVRLLVFDNADLNVKQLSSVFLKRSHRS